MKTFKVLGSLLDYPSEALIEALPDLHAVMVDEGLVGSGGRRALKVLMQEMAGSDPLDLEEQYVAVFDRNRSVSLHLFEHVHGDSRDRGQAMVDLRQMYEKGGFLLAPSELPDYLPAMLEYLSRRPVKEAREMLSDCAHILRSVGTHLRDRGSAYHAVFTALLEVAGEEGLGRPGEPAAVDSEAEREAMDALWAEQPAFGPGTADASCSAAASGRGCGTGWNGSPALRDSPRAA